MLKSNNEKIQQTEGIENVFSKVKYESLKMN